MRFDLRHGRSFENLDAAITQTIAESLNIRAGIDSEGAAVSNAAIELARSNDAPDFIAVVQGGVQFRFLTGLMLFLDRRPSSGFAGDEETVGLDKVAIDAQLLECSAYVVTAISSGKPEPSSIGLAE